MPLLYPASFCHMLRRTLTLLVAASTVAIAGHAVADDNIYPDAFMKSHPQTEQAFQHAIKPLLKQHRWVARYGTMTPVDKYEQDGMLYTVVSGCKPHDCSTEHYTALVDIHSNVRGVLAREEERPHGKVSTTTLSWFGDVDEASRQLILKAMLDMK